MHPETLPCDLGSRLVMTDFSLEGLRPFLDRVTKNSIQGDIKFEWKYIEALKAQAALETPLSPELTMEDSR